MLVGCRNLHINMKAPCNDMYPEAVVVCINTATAILGLG